MDNSPCVIPSYILNGAVCAEEEGLYSAHSPRVFASNKPEQHW